MQEIQHQLCSKFGTILLALYSTTAEVRKSSSTMYELHWLPIGHTDQRITLKFGNPDPRGHIYQNASYHHGLLGLRVKVNTEIINSTACSDDVAKERTIAI